MFPGKGYLISYNIIDERRPPCRVQSRLNNKTPYGFQISLTIAGPTRKLVEGSDVQFLCLTKANPPEVTYRWFVNDQFASSEVTSELWLINITRRLHNSLVRCEAHNSVNKTEESRALSILCKYNNHNYILTIMRRTQIN